MKLEKANRHLNRAKNCNYCEKKKFCIRKKKFCIRNFFNESRQPVNMHIIKRFNVGLNKVFLKIFSSHIP